VEYIQPALHYYYSLNKPIHGGLLCRRILPACLHHASSAIANPEAPSTFGRIGCTTPSRSRRSTWQEADGPVVTGQDPEQTITTVCSKCNNGWMSTIENKASTRLKSMLLNHAVEIDRGGMKLLQSGWFCGRWCSSRSNRKRERTVLHTRGTHSLQEKQTIPDRTRVWVGALENSHIGYHGTDFTLLDRADGNRRIGTGSVGTIYAGHILMQTVTEHIHSPDAPPPGPVITPPAGPGDERLVEIYPRSPKKIDWPTKPFTDEGDTGIIAFHARWRIGEKIAKIQNFTLRTANKLAD